MTPQEEALQKINEKFVSATEAWTGFPVIPHDGDTYNLYVSPRVCWHLRTYGSQKRRKGFNLKRDLPAYYP